ncbi:MAG: outer membrane lipoprotein-sorting protein [Myxococcales bacterium]|nr:outer membrane lipoprotein-sorting protein [Myxococcales bacterium]
MTRLALLAPLFSIALVATAAAAPPDVNALKAKGGTAVLEAIDKRTYDYTTQKWVFRMTVKEKGGQGRQVTFSVWQKGNKRLVRFLEPGDVKGMSMLSAGDGDMYVYSPQTDNVRRVASSARRQTLLGSNMTYEDMNAVMLAPLYDAAFGEDAATHLWLDLTRKAGADTSWEKLRLRVDKKAALVDHIEYWEGGKKVREQVRNVFTEEGGAPTWKSIAMTDVGTGLSTSLEMLEQKIGDDIPDNIFSKRSLVRGQ